MIVEANRLVADWLNDPTHGINALLATTPLDSGDSAPVALNTVSDETRDENAARGQLPDVSALPICFVSVDAITDLDGQVVTVTRDGKIKLSIRVALSNSNTANGVRDMSYYLRTVMRSLRKLFDSVGAARNDIVLEFAETIAEQIAWAPGQQDASIVNGYVIPIIQLRDLAP